MLFDDVELQSKYPCLSSFTQELKRPSFTIQSRDHELKSIEAALNRPELCNVLLLGEPGSGKTALVQSVMMHDTKRLYLEVDLSKMIADTNDVNEMATRLKSLCDEVTEFRKDMQTEVVLFMDEFHQVMMLSNAAAEAMKPLLADSGTRGVRIIAATTEAEFRMYIAPNQPLVERLQRIRLRELDRQATINVLKNRAVMYGVDDQLPNDNLYELIYEYTQRYIPANAQPRKSLLVLDAMIGWYRSSGRILNKELLADVIYESEGVNVTFKVDATSIKKELDKYVFAQDFATTVIEQRLQICVADLNNKSKPMSSFLMTGSTGVGKAVPDDTLIPVYDKDGNIHHKRNGDLVVGDYVFDRLGQPTLVTGIYPQGLKSVYEVEFTDGRTLRVSGNHLWTYKSRYGNGSNKWKVTDTKTLMEKYKNKYYGKGRKAHNIKFVIPMNHAVQYPDVKLKLHPYAFGVLIGNGCLTLKPLELSSGDEFVVNKVRDLLGAEDVYDDSSNYSYGFYKLVSTKSKFQTRNVLSEVPDLIGCKSGDKFIPDIYKYSSIEQRWNLIQGLFDTDGTIDASSLRYNISYSTTSKRLAYDIQDILYSLGVSSSVNVHHRDSKSDEYDVHVKCDADIKANFFCLPRKKDIASNAVTVSKTRVKKFSDVLGIRDIRKLDEKVSMTCIMVDNEEHLYQAGQYIVTHNTEVTKQLARILFGDNARTSLIRFDMTEYANEDSLERFRSELAQRVWNRPYSIVLLDEIEKACAPVTRILLQVLDDGRIMDENNREVSFLNSYIVLTTNAGSEIYKTISQYASDDTGSGKEMKKYDKLIRQSISSTTGDNRFPPELLGRIDTIVPFQPLSEETKKKIVSNKLEKLVEEVAFKHNIQLSYEQKVIQYIVEDNLDTDSDSGGARGAIAKLEAEVTTAVARFINKYPNAYRIKLVVKGQMMSENKNQLESSAYIAILANNSGRTVVGKK